MFCFLTYLRLYCIIIVHLCSLNELHGVSVAWLPYVDLTLNGGEDANGLSV